MPKKLTLLLSSASALCSSFCLKQLLHLLLLKIFGANFRHSAAAPRIPPPWADAADIILSKSQSQLLSPTRQLIDVAVIFFSGTNIMIFKKMHFSSHYFSHTGAHLANNIFYIKPCTNKLHTNAPILFGLLKRKRKNKSTNNNIQTKNVIFTFVHVFLRLFFTHNHSHTSKRQAPQQVNLCMVQSSLANCL